VPFVVSMSEVVAGITQRRAFQDVVTTGELTISSVQTVVFALSFVQYRTCSVPELRPGKKSAICFQVRFFFSFKSTSSWSSSGVNLSLGPRGR
jgi:hypothetical protein